MPGRLRPISKPFSSSTGRACAACSSAWWATAPKPKTWRWTPSISSTGALPKTTATWAAGCTGWAPVWASTPCATASAGCATKSRPAARPCQESPGWDPAQQVEKTQDRQQVRMALARMKPRSARLLLLRHSGLSYAEIAAALEIAPGSVGTLLARAEDEFEREYRRQEEGG